MARVTKPEGVVAACVWDFRGGLTFLRVFADTAAVLDPGGDGVPGQAVLGPLYRPGRTRGSVGAAGLREVEQAALTIRWSLRPLPTTGNPGSAGRAQ